MAWQIEFEEQAEKDLARLDKSAQRAIARYLRERIAPADDPTMFGKPLRHDRAGVWRYRVGDYRILCQLERQRVTVVVVAVGHRKDIYER